MKRIIQFSLYLLLILPASLLANSSHLSLKEITDTSSNTTSNPKASPCKEAFLRLMHLMAETILSLIGVQLPETLIILLSNGAWME
jgi:hypothetical protein